MHAAGAVCWDFSAAAASCWVCVLKSHCDPSKHGTSFGCVLSASGNPILCFFRGGDEPVHMQPVMSMFRSSCQGHDWRSVAKATGNIYKSHLMHEPILVSDLKTRFRHVSKRAFHFGNPLHGFPCSF